MVGEWLLEGDFFWRMDVDCPAIFPAGPFRSSPWSSSSVKTLCSYTLDCLSEKSQEKPVASENRRVRETHVRESQDQNKTFKLILCQSLVNKFIHFRLFCLEPPPKKKTSCVRKSQRQRDVRQRVAGPKKAFIESSSSSVKALCSLPNFRLFSRKNPRKKPSYIRKSQSQRVARRRAAGPNKGLEAHPLSKLCVHCHTLHVGNPPRKKTSRVRKSQDRSPAASENRSVRESHVRESQAQKRP